MQTRPLITAAVAVFIGVGWAATSQYRGITPHVHLELYEFENGADPGAALDPTNVIGPCQVRDPGFA